MRSFRVVRIPCASAARSALAVLLAMAVITVVPLSGAFGAVAGSTDRLSLTDSDVQANDRSQSFSVSADGRFVAFASYATNLVPDDTGAKIDIFVRDNYLETTKRISVSPAGVQGNGHSGSPAISPDGRYIAFYSEASNLVAGDTNGTRDVFVYDRYAEAAQRVSVGAGGVQADGLSTYPSISYNGQKVVFTSDATNLLGPGGDPNGQRDVFVRDTATGVVQKVSKSTGGASGDGWSQQGVISSNGQYVAFESLATNLVAGDANGVHDVFLRDIGAGITSRLSVSTANAEGDGESRTPVITADGSHVVFNSAATNLVAGDTNGRTDVFLRTVNPGDTERVNLSWAGQQANGEAISAINQTNAVTSNGRFVVFASQATNMVVGDTNGKQDVFVRDLDEGETTRMSVPATGAQSNGDSGFYGAAISADWRWVFFASDATNMVSGDTNAKSDLFRHVYYPYANEIDIAGLTRFDTAIAASKAAYPGPLPLAGKRTVIIATARNWPDALGGSGLAGALGGPILLVDRDYVPNDVLDEITRLNAANAIILGGTNAVGPEVEQTLNNGLEGLVQRLAGLDRYETANKIAARVVSENGGAIGNAFVATGGNFADALAAAPIAAANSWPLYLSHPATGLSTATKNAMALGASDVFILGGTSAVSSDVEDYLQSAGFKTDRIQAADRYATAVAIAEFGVASGGLTWNRAGIATGQKFPDALAGSVLQGVYKSPMLLTRSTELPLVVSNRLTAMGTGKQVFVYGGTGAVSNQVRWAIQQAMPSH